MKLSGDDSFRIDRRSNSLRYCDAVGLIADNTLKTPVKSGAEGAKLYTVTANLSGKRTEYEFFQKTAFEDISYHSFIEDSPRRGFLFF